MQEALANFIWLQQGKRGLYWPGVFRPNRADQNIPPVAEADMFVPRGHAVASGHGSIIA
jgi:hypothetical protein